MVCNLVSHLEANWYVEDIWERNHTNQGKCRQQLCWDKPKSVSVVLYGVVVKIVRFKLKLKWLKNFSQNSSLSNFIVSHLHFLFALPLFPPDFDFRLFKDCRVASSIITLYCVTTVVDACTNLSQNHWLTTEMSAVTRLQPQDRIQSLCFLMV